MRMRGVGPSEAVAELEHVHLDTPVVVAVDAGIGPVLEAVADAQSLVDTEVEADIQNPLQRPAEFLHVTELPFRE